MEKKYLFFDIDGTLTDRTTGEIVPSAKKALRRLEEQGHFVAIATGRAHYKAEKFTKANDFKYLCFDGNKLHIEQYFRDQYIPTTEVISQFINWLKKEKLLDVYKDYWKSKY